MLGPFGGLPPLLLPAPLLLPPPLPPLPLPPLLPMSHSLHLDFGINTTGSIMLTDFHEV